MTAAGPAGSPPPVDRTHIPVGPLAPVQPLIPGGTKMKDTQGNDTDEGYSFGLQGQEPTMECVKRYVQELCPGDDWHLHLAGFESELPKDASGAVQFTSYGKPKCFQAEVTFKVDIQTNTGPKTIEFSQVIKTGIQIPISGDDRATREATLKALFMLEGYRHAIKEPIYEHNVERIEHLAQTKILYIKANRADPSEGFYGRNIRWENETPQGSISRVTIEGFRDEKVSERVVRYLKNSLVYMLRPAGIIAPDLFYFETSHYYRDQTHTPPKTIWNTKIHCPELAERDKLLKELEAAALKNDAIKLADAAKALQKSPEPGLTPSQIVTMLARNAFQSLEQLDISLGDSALSASTSEVDAPSLDVLLKAQKELPAIVKKYKIELEELKNELEEEKKDIANYNSKKDMYLIKWEENPLIIKINKKKEDIDRFEKSLTEYPKIIEQIKQEAKQNFERQNALHAALTQFQSLPEAAAIKDEVKDSIDAFEKLQTDFDIKARFDAFIEAYDAATT